MKKLLPTVLGLLIVFCSFGQQQDSAFNMVDTLLIKAGIKNPFRIKAFNAEEQMLSENYGKAIDILEELVLEEPDNFNINYKLGVCYLKTKLEKHKAIKYLEKSVLGTTFDYDPGDLLETKAPIESHYYLGEAYHYNYQFDQAIDTLMYLESLILPEDYEFLARIDRIVKYCNNAKMLVDNSSPIILTHLGNGINTECDEHSPVFPEDESFLVFTSKRSGSTGKLQLDDGTFYEDIYISYKRNGVWKDPVKIDENINTDFNEASVGISPDGRTLIIYRSEGEDGNLFLSKVMHNGFWSIPEPFSAPINSRYRETDACMTSDENTLYFTSDRPGGFGGSDIYVVRKLPDGTWGKEQNMGAGINTPFNEESPQITPDGNTLYFSSQGHNTMGGYDIFYTSRMENGSWAKVKNMGYPVNTTEDDIFFNPTSDGRRAYYSTQFTGGMGLSDIFMIAIPGKAVEALSVIEGYISLSNDSNIMADISVFDYNTNKRIGKYSPNPKTGKYILILPPGKTYRVVYEAKNYVSREENIFIDKTNEYNLQEKVIELEHITLSQNENPASIRDTVCIQNILFDFDKNSTQVPDLDILTEFLKKNTDAIIEIGGHADVNGPEIYNIHLSLTRSIFVYQYLLGKGVERNQLVVKGFGERYPLIKNIPDGAEFDSLHKYNRRVEFDVIREGRDYLCVRPIEVPEHLKTENEENDELKDSDGDGIIDKVDRCPDFAGVEENDGCPEVKEEVKTVMREAMEGLFFNLNSADIKEESFVVLDKVALIMKDNPDYKLFIQGHTDNSGDPSFNLDLSKKRAAAAKDFLINKGIEETRIASEGYGDTRPLENNDTREGRTRNRRVEFTIEFWK